MGETIDGYAVPVHRTEVDGVPCFWADLPVEFEARLVFRVGAYDETLATRGTTHLIEHLAISDTPLVPWRYFAHVTGHFTTLSVAGSQEQVADGLDAVTARLRELPLGRIAATRRGLLTEDSRTSSAMRSLRTRYGARGPGLAGFPEYGVRRVTPEHLATWARERFTARNAVLVLTGPPPPGLRCRLYDGPRWPVVEPAQNPGDPPYLIACLGESWGLSYVTPQSVAESAASEVLRMRVVDRLHYGLGIADWCDRMIETVGAALSHRYLWGGLREGHDDDVLEVVLGNLRALADDGPTDHELTTLRAWAYQYAASPDNGLGWLEELAEAELLDCDPVLANWDEAHAALDAADVAEVLAEALPTLVVESNTDVPAADLGLGDPPGWVRDPIEGTEFRSPPSAGRDSERLVIGDDGVALIDGDDTATIRLGDLAILTKEDDTRELIDLEGGWITVGAREWANGRWAFALLDGLVPAELSVDLDVDGPEEPHFYLDGEA